MPPILGKSPNAGDQICIDHKKFKQLFAFVCRCVEQLEHPRDCEIFLTSLDIYLSESNSSEARKSLLLLNYYRDVVPELLEDIAG
jgi:hypothetical protein